MQGLTGRASRLVNEQGLGSRGTTVVHKEGVDRGRVRTLVGGRGERDSRGRTSARQGKT